MTVPTFVPGYLGIVTLNTDDISASGSVVSLERSRNVMPKPVFGAPYGYAVGGQKLGTFSANGHVTTEHIGSLEAAFESDLPIPFTLQVGAAAGPTDAGLYEGDCVVTTYTIEGNADGEFDWSIEAQTSGVVVYTPAVAGP